MAHVYSITDGTDTIYLNAYTAADPFQVARWLLQTPTPSQMAQGAEGSDSALSPWSYGSVTETIELAIFADVGGLDYYKDVRRIQTMLDKARLRQQTGMGAKVYIQANLDVGEQTWRSEILAGRLALKDAPAQMFRKWLDASLSYTRRYFWEAVLETQMLLNSSADPTGTFTEVDAYNNDDASPTLTNYVLVQNQAADPTALPAPMRIEIENQVGSTINWRDFYLCNWVTDDATIVDPFLLGSEASPSASYTLTTSEADAWRWTADAVLTLTRTAQLAGKPYHILVAFGAGAATTGVYLRAVAEADQAGSRRALLQTGLTLYSGEGLVDLGVLPLPPGGYDTMPGRLSLAIRAFRPAGAATMTIDFVQLTPAGDGIFQRLRQIDFGGSNGSALVADGMEDRAYLDNGGGYHEPLIRKRSLPILFYPGSYNRLRFLFNEEGGFTAGRHFLVRVTYRPRKLDL